MNSKQKLDSSKEDEVVERMARVGYESMFDAGWDGLNPLSIERALWLQIASNMLTELRRTWEQAKTKNKSSHSFDRILKKGGYYDCV